MSDTCSYWSAANGSNNLQQKYYLQVPDQVMYQDMEEDYLKCQVEMVKSCTDLEERDNLVDHD